MTVLSRRNLLLGGAATLGAGLIAGPGARASVVGAPRNLILIVNYGGWDVTYALDPKPGLSTIDVPEGEIEQFAGIPIYTDPSRPAVTEFFAAHAGLCTVINGIQVQSIVHSDCAKRVLTGTPSDTNPDIGAITAFEHANDMPAPYLVLGQTSYAGPYAAIAARTGTANQLGALLDPEAAFLLHNPYDPAPVFTPDESEESFIREFVAATAERERATRGQVGYNRARVRDFVDSLERGDDLKHIGALADLDYTRDLAVQTELALTAFQKGLSYVAQLEIGDWDTHEYNARQADKHMELYSGLKYLVDELAARPGQAAGSKMLDETVVAVVSEMSRTPKLNEDMGKDHWPVTSGIVLGGGIKGGRVLGETNDKLGSLSVDLATGQPSAEGTALQYGNVAAGLLALVGVDPAQYLPNSEPFHALCS